MLGNLIFAHEFRNVLALLHAGQAGRGPNNIHLILAKVAILLTSKEIDTILSYLPRKYWALN